MLSARSRQVSHERAVGEADCGPSYALALVVSYLDRRGDTNLRMYDGVEILWCVSFLPSSQHLQTDSFVSTLGRVCVASTSRVCIRLKRSFISVSNSLCPPHCSTARESCSACVAACGVGHTVAVANTLWGDTVELRGGGHTVELLRWEPRASSLPRGAAREVGASRVEPPELRCRCGASRVGSSSPELCCGGGHITNSLCPCSTARESCSREEGFSESRSPKSP